MNVKRVKWDPSKRQTDKEIIQRLFMSHLDSCRTKFDEIKGGGPGGDPPQESRGVWAGRRPPMSNLFFDSIPDGVQINF